MSMGVSVVLTLYTAFFSWVIYTFIYADPKTSAMASFFTIRIPRYANRLLLSVLGKGRTEKLHNMSRHFLALFYLTVVLGSWSIMFAFGYPWILRSNHVSSLHTCSGGLLFLAALYSHRTVHLTPPGYITPHTLPRYQNTYPYDHLLYPPNRICPTLGIPRLPRSKYDRASRRHVARFDHYCGWVQNAVGEENYCYFLLFLALHVFMCLYGVVVTVRLFRGEAEDLRLMEAVYVDALRNEEVQATVWVVVNYMSRRHFQMAAVLVLMGVMAVVLALFLAFHLVIAARGMTTNEYFKWKQVREWHKAEKRRYDMAKKDGTLLVNETGVKGVVQVEDVDVGCVGPVGRDGVNAVGDTAARDDGDKPMPAIADPGPFPNNIYNLGFVENYKEIIFPRSLRKDALERWALSLEERAGRKKKKNNPDGDRASLIADPMKEERAKSKVV